MKCGQHIIFDENHHSGVYERVQEKMEKVHDIYENPDKYDEKILEHHTSVALRELALEEVRRKKYPQFPSRMSCLYVSRTLKEAEQWGEFFARIGRPTYSIVKLDVKGNCFAGDAEKCFDGRLQKAENLKLAEYARNNLNKIPGIHVLDKSYCDNNNTGRFSFDETRLVIKVDGLRMSGFQVYYEIRKNYNIQLELAETYLVLAILAIGSTKDDVDKLIEAFKDMSNGTTTITKSTAATKETIEIDGVEYPLVKMEISNTSHPFYTGKIKLIDTAGRVDKFMNRYKNHMENRKK